MRIPMRRRLRILLLMSLAISALPGCATGGEAKPVISDEHCEADPFNGSYRATGEVRNQGKTGDVSVHAKVELVGGETKEAVAQLGTMQAGQTERYLLKVVIPENAQVVRCTAEPISF
jgi:hypothetical protein